MSEPQHVVLLDMDGTITPARRKVEFDVCNALAGVAIRADIGIVSGSGYDYVKEQCGDTFATFGLGRRIVLLPCNGTQKYVYKDGDWELEYSSSIKEKLGVKTYNRIIEAILLTQASFIHTVNGVDIDVPISGRFISFRDSLVNWSIIGRDVSFDERDYFASLYGKDGLRNYLVEIFRSKLSEEDNSKITVALGGQTGVDIYPVGWDKRYALGHYPDKTVWFVGDRCQPGQNDYHIYEELKKEGRAFETSGPEETIEILDRIAYSMLP